MCKTILVIEDEPSIQRILKAFLEDAGYRVVLAGDGLEGVARFRACGPELVLLDLMLPKMDGFSVCQLLRRESRTPVIMLTALDDEDSQLKGFDVLADDYITKPFSMPLVLRRIEAVLRRGERPEQSGPVLLHQGIRLDTERRQVQVKGRPVSLTAREFEILRTLLEHPGRVYTRDSLLDLVWGYDYFGDPKIVNTHIKNLRRKLGDACIETVRGVGYRAGGEA